MILTPPIILALFLAGLGLAPGLVAAAAWLRHTLRPAPPADGAPDEAYLVFLLLLTAFGLRVLAWPLSYIALDSAVPHVPGAMCIFGVTRLAPLWANLLQTVRPLLLLALGGWLALRLTGSGRERRSRGGKLNRPLVERALLPTSLFLLILDCLLEFAVLLSLRPGMPVYCCGSVYDLPHRFSALVPDTLFGAQHAHLLLPILHFCGLICAVTCLVSGTAAWNGRWNTHPWHRLRTAAALVLPLVLLLFVAAAGIAAMEVLAPRLTGLPFHHCLYCLLGKTTAGPWLAILLAAAVLTSAWGALLLRQAGRPSGVLLISGGLLVLIFLALTALAAGSDGGEGRLGRCPSCNGGLYDTVYLVELVTGGGEKSLFCSVGCALKSFKKPGGKVQGWVTVRDEFTGKRLDSGAAFFVEAAAEIKGLPAGNRWHAYQYLENAHIMAFELDGNIVDDPFSVAGAE